MRYTDELYEKQKGMACTGRICCYSRAKGYGFIRTEGTDLFLSSFNFAKKKGEKHAVIGALVSFVPEPYGEGYSATKVEVLDPYPAGQSIQLPDGRRLRLKSIRACGIRSGEDGLFVFFSAPGGEVRITAADLGGHGRDVAGYWKGLERMLFSDIPGGKEGEACRQQQ